jgi:uncharacterized protein YxeA
MKKVLSLSILIIAVSIGYYFVMYLPQKNRQQQSIQQQQEQAQNFTKQQECHSLGEKQYSQDKVDDAGLWTLEAPTYHYNKKLNTCLYGVQKGAGFDKSWKCAAYTIEVTDLLSNSVILTITQNGPTCQTTMNREVFDKQYNQLFSE